MGRRGGGGGSAGGGRSGKRNQITYEAVIPKFLQGLVQKAPVDATQAKRESATHHLGVDAEDRRPACKDTQAINSKAEIEALQKQGFSVICDDETVTKSDHVRGAQASKTPYKLGSRGIEKTKKSKARRSKKLSFDVDGSSDEDVSV